MAPLRTPPPELKEKILRRVSPAQAKARPAPTRANSGSLLAFLRSLAARPSGMAWAAAALLLVIALAASNFALWRQVSGLQARIPAESALRVISLAGTESAPVSRGYLMVFQNENYGTLVVEHAPALDPGYQYQLWLIQDGKRTSGGVFSVDEQGYGVLEVNAQQPLDSFPAFGVTIEPEGGSPGPTGIKVLGGDL
jgi:anti-sigma-K factor RskA